MAKTSAIIFGVILVIAGVWGFFASPVLGFLAADTVSSIIHVVLGIVLVVVASKPSAVTALKTVGIIYVIFGILGLIGGDSVIGIFGSNSASNWFYLIVGVVIAILGFTAKKGGMSAPMSTPMSTPQM